MEEKKVEVRVAKGNGTVNSMKKQKDRTGAPLSQQILFFKPVEMHIAIILRAIKSISITILVGGVSGLKIHF